MLSPSCPVLLLPSPCRPRWAVYSGLNRKCRRVLRWMVATIVISPPRPPSPPLGPPRGTYFSRRNARQPLPPSPAFTVILTSSTSMCFQLKPCTPVGRASGPAARFPLGPAALDIPGEQKRPPCCRRQTGGLASLKFLTYSAATMLTNLPIRPRSRNCTVPVTVA